MTTKKTETFKARFARHFAANPLFLVFAAIFGAFVGGRRLDAERDGEGWFERAVFWPTLRGLVTVGALVGSVAGFLSFCGLVCLVIFGVPLSLFIIFASLLGV